jgi:DNA (cytosine-5)-methyltransferase 1
MSGPRIGALFAGYGGLDMAVSEVFGGEMAWCSEIDKGALKILGHRFPDVPNVGSVTEADWSQVEPVDILTGGSPCQDLSHAGRRAGMTDGTRSNLWVAMREAIAQLRPSIVVWENVRGAYSAGADSALEFCPGCMGDAWDRGPVLRALGRVLGDLSDLGYDARWHGLRAADIGAPHGRFRVFVVATDAERGGRDGWTRDSLGRPIDGAAAARSGADARLHKDHTIRREPHRPNDVDTLARALTDVPCALLPTPAVNDMGEGKTVERWDEWTADMQAKHGNGNGHGKSLAIEAQRAVRRDEHWGDYAAAIGRWEGALCRHAPAPTQTSSKGNPQLSPAFVEWMMGLPAGWVTDVPGITRNEALKALGNGVVPQQAAHALRVMGAWAEVAA